MKKLILTAVIGSILTSCGDGTRDPKKVNKPLPLTDNAPLTSEVTTTVINGVVAPGEDVYPTSYTFIDTKDANICFDAFIRQGISIPSNAVARTLDSRNVNSNGIGISDLETSAIPIMNIVHLDSVCSNVMFQFYNKNGYYCIVKNDAIRSNIKMQFSCDAKKAEIEPIKHNSNGSLNLFWTWFPVPQADPNATTNEIHASITELPCIP